MLSLDNTKVTDAGLVHLQGLSQLRIVTLDRTKITDAGLVHLQGLSNFNGCTRPHEGHRRGVGASPRVESTRMVTLHRH